MGSSIRLPISQSPLSILRKPESTPLNIWLKKPTSKNPPNLRCIFDRKRYPQRFSLHCLKRDKYQPVVKAPSVAEKVQSLDFEFKSLIEPIDRVKRLLHYATLLPPFDETLRIEENRVVGCTAQVWLEVKMDLNGVTRFRVDSDSEITKGFCSCLIWVLDGAEADEILSVNIDDLVEMNVGLPSRGNSRVNTWHNVLISMQKRTKDLVKERIHSLEAFSSFVSVNGSCKEIHSGNRKVPESWMLPTLGVLDAVEWTMGLFLDLHVVESRDRERSRES